MTDDDRVSVDGVRCVFCEMASGRKPVSIVHGDDLVLAFMDIAPINPGHLLVVPREHYATLSELPEATAVRMFTISRHLAEAVRRSGVRCEGVNLFLADGEAAGQDVFHCHLHVRPRFRGDSFRSSYDTTARPSREELDETARRIATVFQELP